MSSSGPNEPYLSSILAILNALSTRQSRNNPYCLTGKDIKEKIEMLRIRKSEEYDHRLLESYVFPSFSFRGASRRNTMLHDILLGSRVDYIYM